MHPAVPEEPQRGRSEHEPIFVSADEVGAFAQGTPFSRWALARYLVGRAIARSVSDSLLILTFGWFVLAALAKWPGGVSWLAVLLAVIGVGTLVVRWALDTLLRRLTDARSHGPVGARLRELVAETHEDVLAELGRLGLPSHTLTLPLLAVRMIGRRRPDTVARLRQFDTDRAVPQARVDELHMLLRDGGGRRGAR